jgi:hypothetical protein
MLCETLLALLHQDINTTGYKQVMILCIWQHWPLCHNFSSRHALSPKKTGDSLKITAASRVLTTIS